ncbi:DUF6737 family protein [Anthocerotibacter panamensis]|uniref:DUF6737 family protein n=1 Tax=Anthocerotibacter panamensis TaxID=2857077 RepID=UPI001C403BE4|nr:DUF6737 family protein [Anthocerotibacter panamensis]
MSKKSVWSQKPWWCQPWSILLTGSVLLGGLYRLGGLSWLTLLGGFPIVVWMVFFVGIYPALYARAQDP